MIYYILLYLLQPISPVDFAGPNFRYVAKWKPTDGDCTPVKEYCEESKAAQEGTIGRPGELNIIEYKVRVYYNTPPLLFYEY